MRKKNVVAVILLIVSFISAYADDKDTNFGLFGGASLNVNLHSASFKGLPGYPNCCVELHDATGLGWQVFAGLRYFPEGRLFGFKYLPQISLGLYNISANFKEQEFIGNVIQGNSYVKGYSEFKLDANWLNLAVSPSLLFFPVEDLPLGVKLGLSAAIPISSSLSQKEKLVTPSDGYYFETLKPTRNEGSGKINELNALFFINLGISYEAFELGAFKISPEIGFDYALNNVVSGKNWKPLSFNAGFTVSYRLMKPEIPPPPPPAAPPLPKMPEAPAAEPLNIITEVYAGDKRINNGSVIELTLDKEIERVSYSVLPMIFFDFNSATFVRNEKFPQNEENAQKLSYINIIEYIQTNKPKEFTITFSTTSDEDTAIAKQRVESVMLELTRNNIDTRIIHLNEVTIDVSKLKYPQLAEEYRFARFEFDMENKNPKSQNLNILNFNKIKNIRTSLHPVESRFIVTATDNNSVHTQSTLTLNGAVVSTYNTNSGSYILDEKAVSTLTPGNSYPIEWSFEAKDGKGGSATADVKANIKYIENKIELGTNIFTNDTSTYEQYILGYFNFDESEFSVTNEQALETVCKAIRNGERVEILALHDNFGDKRHNAALALNRLNDTWVRFSTLLEGNEMDTDLAENFAQYKNLSFGVPDNYVFDNSTAIGRILNRTAIARIYKK
jgi:hypothetical protein